MKRYLAITLILSTILASCEQFSGNHLIKSKAQRQEVETKFAERLNFIRAADTSINVILAQKLSPKELEGFKFLYAYMPLCDLAMLSPSFVFQQVSTALEAKKTFKWGRKIPADIFLHFVLPYRANNEYPDGARQVFFGELKDRLQGMSMYDAALEVNHWCHEKVNYRPSDARTSGPLTVVRTAYGRCGEESTFTVCALRAVGIPARQVYTPRWAHTDDNHAWVEVWVDGKWHFLGACEPDPELNMGWFAAPAKRTMMTRTFTFGKYFGNEEKLAENNFSAELNLLANYASTKQLAVKVIDQNGQAVPYANVEYQLYNYAEFYPIAIKTTDHQGVCSVRTGYGDLMIWANAENQCGFTKADAMRSDTIIVSIASPNTLTNSTFDIIPPIEMSVAPADPQKAAQNALRLQHEDMLRTQYESTFIDSLQATTLAIEKGINIEQTWRALKQSRGNWPQIKNFIENLQGRDITVGMAMLDNLAEKDLHDITAETLKAHLQTVDLYPSLVDVKQFGAFDRYVLSPRIGYEFITPWRSIIQNHFSYDQIGFFRNNPMSIATWIMENIRIDEESNYYRVPISPEGVLKYGTSDKRSRDILFVAICRSLGIPARLEPTTKKPQFLMKDQWHNAPFEAEPSMQPKGFVLMEVAKSANIQKPKYFTHFTIAKLQNGRFVTLDYENSPELAQFPAVIEIETGQYRLVTGNRHSDGSVSCMVSYFEVKKDDVAEVKIDFAQASSSATLSGAWLNPNTLIPNLSGNYTDEIFDPKISRDISIIALVAPGTEPTNHLINDLRAVSDQLAGQCNRLLLVVAGDQMSNAFNVADYQHVTSNTFVGFDKDKKLAQSLVTACNIDSYTNLPIVVAINKRGDIISRSSGYSIGLGQQLLKTIGEQGQ